MPQERAVRSIDRCELHPSAPVVARCEACGRRLCLTCAVPIRGGVFGPECVAQALGEEASEQERETWAPPSGEGRRLAAGIAFAVATVVTLLPWSRFGEGAGWFGAWGRPRWSMLAAIASMAGVALWLGRRRIAALHAPWWDGVMVILGGLVMVGGLLAGLRPPFASRAWFAPWIAAAAGLTVLLACLPLAVGRLGRVAERS